MSKADEAGETSAEACNKHFLADAMQRAGVDEEMRQLLKSSWREARFELPLHSHTAAPATASAAAAAGVDSLIDGVRRIAARETGSASPHGA
jgi:hypothetical protein